MTRDHRSARSLRAGIVGREEGAAEISRGGEEGELGTDLLTGHFIVYESLILRKEIGYPPSPLHSTPPLSLLIIYESTSRATVHHSRKMHS